MTPDERVLDALRYFRNVGAELHELRKHASLADDGAVGANEVLAALKRAEVEGTVFSVGRKWFVARSSSHVRGPAYPAEWKPEDSWILLAFLYCEPDVTCTLSQIVAVADFIDHAIPTIEEMHGALNRLKSGGLIQVRKGGFAATPKARALFAKVTKRWKRAVQTQRKGLARILVCPCCGIELRRIDWAVTLTRQQYSEAIESYVGVFRKNDERAQHG